MEFTFNHNGISYSFDTWDPIDISLPVSRQGNGANCFYTERPDYQTFRLGGFVGNVALGGACNVEVIRFTPHGNGTHTECNGHINAGGQTILQTLKDSFLLARLITVEPTQIADDRCMDLASFEQADLSGGMEAVVVRSLPNNDFKRSRDYSGSNPPYFSADALAFLREKGVVHLLCDVPSVDRESDEGKLLAHKAFFGEGPTLRREATITELVYVPDSIPDGLYLLNLQIAPFESDASPSRPLLFKLTPTAG